MAWAQSASAPRDVVRRVAGAVVVAGECGEGVLPTEEGVRVVGPVMGGMGRRGGRTGGPGRGGRRGRGVSEGEGGPSRNRRVNSMNIRWTAVARNAYIQRQNQYGRGEGGGVT